jgi:transcriptional regulator with XRE-family HTH domain
VHKYETGFNRVSASRLYDLSQILGVSIDYFFRGLETNIACTDPTADRAASAASGEPSHLQRIEIALGKITRASLREKVVILIEAMASDSNELH